MPSIVENGASLAVGAFATLDGWDGRVLSPITIGVVLMTVFVAMLDRANWRYLKHKPKIES